MYDKLAVTWTASWTNGLPEHFSPLGGSSLQYLCIISAVGETRQAQLLRRNWQPQKYTFYITKAILPTSELQNACWGCAAEQLQACARSSTRQSKRMARVTKQLFVVQREGGRSYCQRRWRRGLQIIPVAHDAASTLSARFFHYGVHTAAEHNGKLSRASHLNPSIESESRDVCCNLSGVLLRLERQNDLIVCVGDELEGGEAVGGILRPHLAHFDVFEVRRAAEGEVRPPPFVGGLFVALFARPAGEEEPALEGVAPGRRLVDKIACGEQEAVLVLHGEPLGFKPYRQSTARRFYLTATTDRRGLRPGAGMRGARTFGHAPVAIGQDDPGHGLVSLYVVDHARSVVDAVELAVEGHQLGQLHAPALLRQVALQQHPVGVPLHRHPVAALGHQQVAQPHVAEPGQLFLAQGVRVQVGDDGDAVAGALRRALGRAQGVGVVVAGGGRPAFAAAGPPAVGPVGAIAQAGAEVHEEEQDEGQGEDDEHDGPPFEAETGVGGVGHGRQHGEASCRDAQRDHGVILLRPS
ncbi:unnamed protein product [Menidia menidia]|uniref:(Atlantic silverside) hypothetical protein n=1 Tax=Menidia menidia TaxID=238744 RepID=A0A8S4ATN7_9TELE|nr:unnamed protein product [Menidia menidia]